MKKSNVFVVVFKILITLQNWQNRVVALDFMLTCFCVCVCVCTHACVCVCVCVCMCKCVCPDYEKLIFQNNHNEQSLPHTDTNKHTHTYSLQSRSIYSTCSDFTFFAFFFLSFPFLGDCSSSLPQCLSFEVFSPSPLSQSIARCLGTGSGDTLIAFFTLSFFAFFFLCLTVSLSSADSPGAADAVAEESSRLCFLMLLPSWGWAVACTFVLFSFVRFKNMEVTWSSWSSSACQWGKWDYKKNDILKWSKTQSLPHIDTNTVITHTHGSHMVLLCLHLPVNGENEIIKKMTF